MNESAVRWVGRWAASLGIAVLLAADRGGAQATPTSATPQREFGEFGRLDTRIRQVRRPTCWTLEIRGRLHNPYDEPVDGARVVIRLRAAGDAGREMHRIEVDVDSDIAPHGSVPFARALETPCSQGAFHDITVVAFALHRGAQPLPVLAQADEVAASRVETAASPPSGLPIVTSPVALP